MNEELHQHFQNVREIIRHGKLGAYQAVNAYAIVVNWQIGHYLSKRLLQSSYGDKVVDRLADWLQAQEPGLKGYDRRSLYRMRSFFETWHELIAHSS